MLHYLIQNIFNVAKIEVLTRSIRLEKNVAEKLSEVSDEFMVSQNDIINMVLSIYFNIPTLESRVLSRNPGIDFRRGQVEDRPKEKIVIQPAPTPMITEVKEKIVAQDQKTANQGINPFGNIKITMQEPDPEDEDK